MRSPAPFSALALLALCSCTDSGGGFSGTLRPTVILVDPDEFLGDVACADSPGALRRYVATLVDVTRSPTSGRILEVSLPSSDPVSCHLGVAFDRVTGGLSRAGGNFYVADIQGYDRSDLRPSEDGSSIMLTSSGDVATPRWATSCGRSSRRLPFPVSSAADAGLDASSDADASMEAGLDASALEAGADASPVVDAADTIEPPALVDSAVPMEEASTDAGIGTDVNLYPHAVRAITARTIRVHHCEPLIDLTPGPANVTAIAITPARALAGLLCGGDGGVENYSVAVKQTGELRSATCSESIVVGDLEPGTEYVFDVRASDAAGASWATTCFGVARAGLTITAACDPLVPLN
jgi:hypothetical protein